jgi:hypothetical protein
MRRAVAVTATAVALAGCTSTVITGSPTLSPPTNLTYQLLPSGDPTTPEGVQLRWEPPNDANVTNYVVYSRASAADPWSRRAETTSAAFLDLGIPDLQYYVASEAADGTESSGSNVVTVDPSNQLLAPAWLSSVSLDRAVALSWSDRARTSAPDRFAYYRVYSTVYDLDRNLCTADWVLEGTTVSEDFIASGLPNGVPRCFAVSAISADGHESDWTDPRSDTPRYDARNVVVYASQSRLDSSAFAFEVPSTGELGAVRPGNRTDVDFQVDRMSDGSLWLVPVRAGTTVALYGDRPIEDLTSIDLAPLGGFSRGAIEAVPGYGYVFQMTLPDGLHFGGLRVTHVAYDFVIFDWSYQTDPGNPELVRVAGRR